MINSLAVFDLHADLLSYLASSAEATPYDPFPHCSLSQLKAGDVRFQGLPIFTKTAPGSVNDGERQILWYLRLLKEFPVRSLASVNIDQLPDELVVAPAVENLSGFFEEDEPLDLGIKRFEDFISRCGRPIYVSLTWFGDNRFGGGNDSERGLTEDGRILVDLLRDYKISIDLSHAGENLVRDLIDREDIQLMASHSNARALLDIQRNLSDQTLKQIIRRNGLIGVNAVRRQHGGESLKSWVKNVLHMLDLGAQDLLCFGVDFFDDRDYYQNGDSGFFPELQDASQVQNLISALRNAGYKEQDIVRYANGNIRDWIRRL